VPQAFSHMPLIQTALNLDSQHAYGSRRPSRRTAPQAKLPWP
jgi:hypothetical protein